MTVTNLAADNQWMQRALTLARKGEGHTRPNPPVGAVIVRNGKVLGEGFHQKAGQPHAEIIALNQADNQARRSTLYVTLEPCCTRGRTGPCTEAIIQSGIQRVVVGTEDPNPSHRGAGLRRLKRAGIHVDTGVCESDASRLIRPFAKWITTGRPYVTLKIAMSLDGKIADRKGSSRWISCPSSREYVQAIRAVVDAILVGGKTARLDNPSLGAGTLKRLPLRVVVDSSGNLPLNLRIFTDGAQAQTLIATTRKCPTQKVETIRRLGAQVWVLPEKQAHVSITSLLSRLGRAGFLHVLCEGGGMLAENMIRNDLIDEYLFFVAPKIIGSQNAAAAVQGTGWGLNMAPKVRFTDVEPLGCDVMIRAVPER